MDDWFYDELRRDERLRVGRLDSRFTVRDAGAGEGFGSDPSYSAIQGPYTAALNDYLRRELDVEIDDPYEILTGRVWPWSYKEFQNRYVDVAENLRQAMRKNPALEVFVANGYYDVATSFFATEYTFGGLDYLGDLNARVKMAYYEAGHMMYVHRGELRHPSEVWRGLRPCTPDGLPLVGRLQSLNNVIIAGGHDTKGMTLGPLTGQHVTRLLAGQSIGDFEQKLSPSRFRL